MMRSGRMGSRGAGQRRSRRARSLNAEALRADDFPFEVVADHPRLVRADSELFHCMLVGPLLGLAEAVLALDLDVVETPLSRPI